MLSISQVAFSRWSPYSILKSSVIAVEEESDLSSPLLGVVFGGKCPTCYQTKHNCPGHFGSIRLTEPVYHISWVPHLLRLLKKHDGKFIWDKQWGRRVISTHEHEGHVDETFEDAANCHGE